MASEGGPTGGSNGSSNPQQMNSPQFPHGMYPMPYGPPPNWGPPQAMPPGPWMNTWPGGNIPNMAGQQWPSEPRSLNAPTTSKSNNEYTVDSMRRIYNNTDASIEIERVKFQSKQPMNPTQANLMGPTMIPFPGIQPTAGVSNALVPMAGPQHRPERRPPPRKNRKNKSNNEVAIPQQFYPHSYPPPAMGYMPYPYAYPMPYFPYPWYPPNWTSRDQHQDKSTSVTPTPDILRNDTRTPLSILDSTSDQSRPLSPAQSSDIAPSDSVSAGGYHKGNKTNSVPDWMIEMQKHLANVEESSEAADQSSFTTANSSITPTPTPTPIPTVTPTPPVRRSKLKNNTKDVNGAKTTLVTTDKSGTDLNYAFKKLEKSVDVFRNQVEEKISDIMKEEDAPIILPSTIAEIETEKQKESDRGSSSAEYVSVRNTPVDEIVKAGNDTAELLPMSTEISLADKVSLLQLV